MKTLGKTLGKTLAGLLGVILLSACVTQGGQSRSERLAENAKMIDQFIETNQITSKSTVNPFKYHGWIQIDDQFLILETSPNRLYLVRLNSICDGLRFANSIAVQQSTPAGLSEKFDRIRPIPNGSYDCIIEKIYPIDREQKRNLLSQFNALKVAREKS